MKAKLITLPNIITLANLLCGTLGIISMVSLQSAGALRVAFVLMLAAALFDFLDGFVARLTGQYSLSEPSSIRWPTWSVSSCCRPSSP